MVALNAAVLEGQMRKQRLSYRALAERADVSHNTVYNILNGRTTPTLDTVNRIARALGVNAFVLLMDRGDEELD